ncbi:MAG: hypothetical protein K2K80_05005, partial [Clostridia bacterium]|nr:hypothetical protein [Clostridia bacterium]
MKNVITIIKKEFARFFKDKRMVITVLLPGILIYALYSILGTVMADLDKTPEDYKPTAYISAPSNYEQILNVVTDNKQDYVLETAKKAVEEGSLDIAVVFPENFNETYGTANPPEVKIYYNSSNSGSLAGYN